MEPRLPEPGSADYENRLHARLFEIFQQLNPASGWKEVDIDLTGCINGAGDSPVMTNITDDLYAWAFSATTAEGTEELIFNIRLPHDMAYGLRREDGTYQAATIYPHVHWAPAGTDTGNVRWGIEYSYAKVGTAFPASTTIYLEQAGSGTAKEHQVSLHYFSDGKLTNERNNNASGLRWTKREPLEK
jgi:hypothetical protein